ncbi:DNA-directed RNA polymerase sigma-70 factor [Flexivirga endophytica]|uniref:DNA-directed RNA polymerase sigma-70 factor n=1 Tax=Flexivirga endophytica TaxID=1849103 RepID=A0A916T9J7_9MICO|nr:sigma-70 family RNA polymerase sigma factor [Flexivirga endophytica]GGB36956.1 DNA-directed RNA polymerase sigma-70 factor [Flexivirga endophytica]GHB44506.1 DNA-directed RNA polymerase sigma-70 factor [Flexivirga endophytica]
MTTVGSRSDGLADRAATCFRDYRDGDDLAMSRLVDAVTPVMWRTARGAGLDNGNAEDVVQEVWLALYRQADRIADCQAVLQWLLVSTRRRAWAEARRSAKVQPDDQPADDGPSRVAPPDNEPEATVLRSDSERTLWRHFGLLSARCQMLLKVIATGDHPDYAGLAAAMGVSVGSIGPTRGRCLAKLRASLEADRTWEGVR